MAARVEGSAEAGSEAGDPVGDITVEEAEEEGGDRITTVSRTAACNVYTASHWLGSDPVGRAAALCQPATTNVH